MISVVIPTLDAARLLPACLASLVPAAVAGVVGEVIVADGGSRDETVAIADDAGCTVVACAATGRGPQLREGAAAARRSWLLFLHADTVLEAGWHDEAAAFIQSIDSGRRPQAAAAFRFALDDRSWQARTIEAGVALRCLSFKLPYGDQGLLLPRSLYEQAGGYPAIRLMEDVALVRAIPRAQRVMLRSRAVTAARRYTADGYSRRVLRNWACFALFIGGAPIDRIERLYRSGDDHRAR